VVASASNQRANNDSTKDGVAYACLLKNELLGAGIEDVKNQQADIGVSGQRMALVQKESKNVFQVDFKEFHQYLNTFFSGFVVQV
jgi:hypothetical protein